MNTPVFRRDFLKRSLSAIGITSLFGYSFSAWADDGGLAGKEESGKPDSVVFNTFSVDPNNIRFYSSMVTTPLKVMIITDTHLFRDDDRGAAYTEYSGRMAKAYNQTSHFQTRQPTNPEESLVATLKIAKEKKVDAILLLGDMVSFPSEAGIDWLMSQLNGCEIPWHYVSGNHDWHYEGMPGTEIMLRAEWTEKRLKPLYQGRNPMMSTVDLGGIQAVMIDDSVYEILPEQLDFWRQQVQNGRPTILCMHIPLYAPGRGVGYGCGHPDWNATTDHNYEIERRPRWPENGHTKVTFDFYREVFSTPNLLGVFAGHIHEASVDVVHNIPQFVIPTNCNGNYAVAEFNPVRK